MKDYINPRDFGAVGDGMADDTAALQSSFDEAEKTGLSVFISAGRYSTGALRMHQAITVKSDHTWAFGSEADGRTVLVQRFPEQECLIDMTDANGSTLYGLTLKGLGKETSTVGIMIKRDTFGKKEDAFRIDSCRVSGFGSHAASLDKVWCFTIRHSMFAFSGGDGITLHGWDGFISDNWLTGNRGSGWGGDRAPNSSVTMTGNRIEWNAKAGISLASASHYNITGNYIDRSGHEAIRLINSDVIACTGNILYRSGKFNTDDDSSAQCVIEGCHGVTFTGNSFRVGRDDAGKGVMTPPVALRLRALEDCVVSSNAMSYGGMKRLIDNLGDHVNTIIEQNPGSIYKDNNK